MVIQPRDLYFAQVFEVPRSPLTDAAINNYAAQGLRPLLKMYSKISDVVDLLFAEGRQITDAEALLEALGERLNTASIKVDRLRLAF